MCEALKFHVHQSYHKLKIIHYKNSGGPSGSLTGCDMKSHRILQTYIHCHRQWNDIHFSMGTVYTQEAIDSVYFDHVPTAPCRYVISDGTEVTGCRDDFEAGCPVQSCWLYHMLGNSCLVWLSGHLQLPHYYSSEILSCWTEEAAEPHKPED